MKQIKDFVIRENLRINAAYSRLRVAAADGAELPEILPGQFVEIKVPAADVFLRRPISVNDVNPAEGTLDLLVRRAGKGTEALIDLPENAVINIMLPLGRGFSTAISPSSRVLLIGGGVGAAPLLYLGRCLKAQGVNVEFLIGARSAADVLLKDEFTAVGTLHVTTEDGSLGVSGLVTAHPALACGSVDMIYCCGPMPMMKAVAKIAAERGIECEVSLENVMACGLGACLCCVENTVKGNVCVCTEGPVFNIKSLNW